MAETFDDAQTKCPAAGEDARPHLVVMLECDRPLAGGARYSLGGVDEIVLGRGETRHVLRRQNGNVGRMDARLPGRSMSSRHARLVRMAAVWSVEDLGSTNGTFVNGTRVDRAVLNSGDVCEVGHCLIRVDPATSVPANTPDDVDFEGRGDARIRTLNASLAEQLRMAAKAHGDGLPTLILGETGTGKEVLARQLHVESRRAGPWVAVNCGAIPATLVESQLFGHLRGAFSGAVRDELGFVRAADGGTLFLDEIADLPVPSQASLLRVLQEREVVPVGATRPIPVDLRLCAATHASLDELTSRRAFRQDLLARIAGYVVELPPLRERKDDLGILFATLLPRLAPERAAGCSFASEAARAMLTYDWPLNIRELEHVLASCLALSTDGHVRLSNVPPKVLAFRGPLSPSGAGPVNAREEQLRLRLLDELSRHHGNLADVARAMGKARMQIHRWCKRFGINPDVYRH